jgi:hypothetical protein
VHPEISRRLIEAVQGGTLVLAYYPDRFVAPELETRRARFIRPERRAYPALKRTWVRMSYLAFGHDFPLQPGTY